MVGQQKTELQEQFNDLENCHSAIQHIIENNKIRTSLIDDLFNDKAELTAQLKEEKEKTAKLVQEQEFLHEHANENEQFIQKLIEDNERLNVELATAKEKEYKMQVYGTKTKTLRGRQYGRKEHHDIERLSDKFASLQIATKELSENYTNLQGQNTELAQSNGELRSMVSKLATWNEKQLARFIASESHARYLEDLNTQIRATQEGVIKEQAAKLKGCHCVSTPPAR